MRYLDYVMTEESTILVCDDDDSIRRLITAILRADAYRIKHASDVAEARAALDSEAPDLVILDVNIPGGGGGLGVLSHVRSAPELASVRVLLVTGTTAAHAEGWGRSVGADAHLMKPFPLDALRGTVAELLGR